MTQQPDVLQLNPGIHWICTCGHSQNSPYCDGSHKGIGLMPLTLELEALIAVEISGSVNAEVA